MLRILDPEQLAPLYRDEPEALEALFRETVDVTAALIAKLANGCCSRSETLRWAHELKGVCRTTGAEELAFLGSEIEALATLGSWDELEARLEILDKAHQRLVEAVAALA